MYPTSRDKDEGLCTWYDAVNVTGASPLCNVDALQQSASRTPIARSTLHRGVGPKRVRSRPVRSPCVSMCAIVHTLFFPQPRCGGRSSGRTVQAREKSWSCRRRASRPVAQSNPAHISAIEPILTPLVFGSAPIFLALIITSANRTYPQCWTAPSRPCNDRRADA